MEYEGINNVSSDCVESDWLDITYTQRNYLKEEEKLSSYSPPPKRKKIKVGNIVKYAVAVVFLLVALAGMLFVKTENGVFQTARLTYTSSLLQDLDFLSIDKPDNIVKLPATASIDKVLPDGTVILKGGKVATCLAKGKVIEVKPNSVTIKVDEKTLMVYSNLSKVVVKQGQELEQFDCIGKYEQTTGVSVIYNGEAVTEVVGDTYSFSWES
ncbi:MAG: hypothetical protein RR248_02545 [Clostridia bacterium]